MQLLDAFDQVRVISLPHRTDRRQRVVRELGKMGVSFDSPQVRFFDAIRPDGPGDFPSIGARGCFMSHLEVIEGASRTGCRRLLVLEDDIIVSPQFALKDLSLLDELDKVHWDLAYLGHAPTVPVEGLGWVEYSSGVTCMHAYSIPGDDAGWWANQLRTIASRRPGHPDGGPMHVDGAVSTIRSQNPQLTTRLAMPAIFLQGGSRSDISDPRWFDRVPGVRSAANLVRALKGSGK